MIPILADDVGKALEAFRLYSRSRREGVQLGLGAGLFAKVGTGSVELRLHVRVTLWLSHRLASWLLGVALRCALVYRAVLRAHCEAEE